MSGSSLVGQIALTIVPDPGPLMIAADVARLCEALAGQAETAGQEQTHEQEG